MNDLLPTIAIDNKFIHLNEPFPLLGSSIKEFFYLMMVEYLKGIIPYYTGTFTQYRGCVYYVSFFEPSIYGRTIYFTETDLTVHYIILQKRWFSSKVEHRVWKDYSYPDIRDPKFDQWKFCASLVS